VEIASARDGPHFHKDCKELKESKDSEEQDDLRETLTNEKELEGQEGFSGFGIDSKGNSGKTRVETPPNLSGNTERYKQLQTQSGFLRKKYATQ
jgi:hypothetical protein